MIYLTINLPDIIESSIKTDLTATGLGFQARAGKCVNRSYTYILATLIFVSSRHSASKGLPEHDYAFKLEYSEEILPEVSPFLFTRS